MPALYCCCCGALVAHSTVEKAKASYPSGCYYCSRGAATTQAALAVECAKRKTPWVDSEGKEIVV